MEDLITRLRESAKEIYETIYEEQISDVDLYSLIIQTGYEGVCDPHNSTIDLIHLFACNIRNSGAAGMPFDAFGQLIRGSIKHFIDNNDQLILAPEQDFISSVVEKARDRNLPTRYIEHLEEYEQWVRGEEPPYWADNLHGKPRIVRDLESVIFFLEFLISRYDGRATDYSENLRAKFHNWDRPTAVRQLIAELLQIPGMGIALSANFLKDSQAELMGEECHKYHAHSFVKPDKHVLRLMHLITARTPINQREQLFGMKDDQLAGAYFDTTSLQNELWPCLQPRDYAFAGKSQRGQWKCMQDVFFLADQSGASPLEIDRLLYFCGSGNFRLRGLPADYNATQQRDQRYDVIYQHLNL